MPDMKISQSASGLSIISAAHLLPPPQKTATPTPAYTIRRKTL